LRDTDYTHRQRERERSKILRETFLPRFETLIPSFCELSDTGEMSFLLGEHDSTAALAAKYLLAVHNARDS